MDPVRLALDVGPLHGHRTGVGAAVAELAAALAGRSGRRPHAVPAQLPGPTRHTDAPTAAARRPGPPAVGPRRLAPVDRWLAPAEVVHGTNYVVPPSRLPRVVSVYDCWFLANPGLASPAVRRAGDVLRRAAAHGACRPRVQRGDRRRGPRAARHRPGRGHPPGSAAGAAGTGAPGERRVARRSSSGRLRARARHDERRKNLPALVEAFGQPRRARRRRLVLAGAPGDDTPAVRRRRRRPGRRRPATRARAGSRSTPPPRGGCSHHAAALAYPSLDEGFGFPILEAQAAGRRSWPRAAGSIPEVGRRRGRAGPARRYAMPSPARSSASRRRRPPPRAGRRRERPTSRASRGAATAGAPRPACTAAVRERGRRDRRRRGAFRRRRGGPLPARAGAGRRPAAG